MVWRLLLWVVIALVPGGALLLPLALRPARHDHDQPGNAAPQPTG